MAETRQELEEEIDDYMKQLGNLLVRRSKAIQRREAVGSIDSLIASAEAHIARIKKGLR